jgi:hypothetical protein
VCQIAHREQCQQRAQGRTFYCLPLLGDCTVLCIHACCAAMDSCTWPTCASRQPSWDSLKQKQLECHLKTAQSDSIRMS